MTDLYLIEYAYRSIYFLDFLNNSLKNWEFVLNDKNLFLNEKQFKFSEINNDNLLKYFQNEKENENCPKNINNYKINIIRNWATSNKINLSKNLSFDELYELSDKIFLIYKNELNQMRSEKNEILSLCFPQLINNLFGLFEILNEIKKIFQHEKNSGNEKYTKILLECEKKSKLIQSYINNENKYNKEKKELNEQIDKLVKENKKILEDSKNEVKNIEENNKQENIYLLNSNNNLLLLNEFLQSDFNALKQEMDSLKSKMEERENKMENMMNEIENMKTEMEKERTEKEKFMNKIKNYLEETENFFRKQKEDFNENFLKEK